MLLRKTKALTFALPLISFGLLAQTPKELEDVYFNFQKGNYPQVIQSLRSIKVQKKNKGAKHYFMGLAYARLQQYDQASKYFIKAIKEKYKADDIYYELGQALYSINDLSKARAAFKKSAKTNFKRATSNYYIAYISSILEQHKQAKKYYSLVIKDKEASKDLKQVSRYQRAEAMLEMARKKEDTRRIVGAYILPQLRRVVKTNNTNQVGLDASRRIKELEQEFALDPNLLINGKKIPKKRFNAYIEQSVEYDNNITLANDTPTVQATEVDSFYFTTEANMSYKFVFKQRYIIEPEIEFSYTKYQNQDEPDVFANDNYTGTLSLNNRFEHKLFNNPASFILDYDYDYKARDRNQVHELVFNNRTNTITFGERFKYFNIGSSAIKLKFKRFRSYTEDLHFDTTTLSYDQLFILKNGHLGIFLWQFDSNDYFNSITNSTKTNLLRYDHIIPNLLHNMSLNLAFSTTFTTYDDADTALSRGTEKTLNPYIKLSKKMSNHLDLDFSYSYIKNMSDSETQEYTKHTTSTELKYKF